MATFRSKLSALLRRRELHQRVHEELEFHIRMETEENIRQGMAPLDARRAARRKIGNKAWSERVREAVDSFEALLQFDRLYIGGGNAKKLTIDLGHRVQLVDNKAGILGGLKVWEIDVV